MSNDNVLANDWMSRFQMGPQPQRSEDEIADLRALLEEVEGDIEIAQRLGTLPAESIAALQNTAAQLRAEISGGDTVDAIAAAAKRVVENDGWLRFRHKRMPKYVQVGKRVAISDQQPSRAGELATVEAISGNKGELVRVRFDNGERVRFHFAWLRKAPSA